jgi:hypothetical protein
MLERFVGTWRATETLHPSPWNREGGPAEATLVARLALGGKAVLQEYRRGDYEGIGVVRMDGGEVSLWWFDNLGPPGPAKGGVRGEGLVLEGASPVGRARYTYAFVRDGEFTFRIEHSRDGKEWRAYLDARYVRVAPGAPPDRPRK